MVPSMIDKKLLTVSALALVAFAFAILTVPFGEDSDADVVYGDQSDPSLTQTFEIGRTYSHVPVAYGHDFIADIPGMKFNAENWNGLDVITASGTPTEWLGRYMTVFGSNDVVSYVFIETVPSEEIEYGANKISTTVLIEGAEYQLGDVVLGIANLYSIIDLETNTELPTDTAPAGMSFVRYQAFLCIAGTPNATGEYLFVMDTGSFYLTIRGEALETSELVLFCQTTMDTNSEMDAVVCMYNANTQADQGFSLVFNTATSLATISSENAANTSGNHSWEGADFGYAWTVKSSSNAGTFVLKAYYPDGHNASYMNKTVSIEAPSGSIYTVSYNMNGGEESSKPASGDYLDGTDITLPVQGVRSGYYIDGWIEGRSSASTTSPYFHATGSTYKVRSDVTMYAHWTSLPSNFLDGMITSITSGSHYSDIISAPVPSGYEYVSYTITEKPTWMTISLNNKSIAFTGDPVTPGTYVVDITYTYWLDSPSYQLQERVFWYVYVTAEPQMCTIEFNLDGGTGSVITTKTVQAGTVIILPGTDESRATRANSQGQQCPQILWKVKDHSGQTDVYYNLGAIYKVFDNRVFYADYQKAVYTIIYDANGGTVANTSHNAEAYPCTDGSSLTVQCDNIVKPGYKIGGWVVSTTDHGIVPDGYIYGAVSGSIYVKAHWVKEDASDAYTINFQPGTGGSGIPLTMYVSKVNNNGFKILLPNDNFYKPGYELLGWDENVNATTPTYGKSSTPSPQSNKTYYAIWGESETPSDDRCTITFHMNGGQGNANPQTLNVGEHVVMPANPTRSGYVFLGWTYNGTEWVFSRDTISASMGNEAVFVANWDQHYVVTATYLNAKVTILDGVNHYNLYPTTVSWGDGTQDSISAGSTVTKSSPYTRPDDYTITVTTNVNNTLYSSQYTLTARAPDTPIIVFEWTYDDENNRTAIRVDASHSTRVTFWEWYLDGTKRPENTDVITIHASELNDPSGKHTIKLVVNHDPSCKEELDFYFDIDIEEYTVHFELNGGTGDSSTEYQVVAEGSTVVKPKNPTKTGYVFVGWFNGNELWDFDNTVLSDITLTAHWDSHVSYDVEEMTVILTFSDICKNRHTLIYWDYVNDRTQSQEYMGNPSSIDHTYVVAGTYKIRVETQVSSSETLTKEFDIEVRDSAPSEVSIDMVMVKKSRTTFEFDASGSTGQITSYSWYVNGKLDSTATTSKYTLTMEEGFKYIVKLVLNNNTRYSWESEELSIEKTTAEGAKYLAPVCVVIIGAIASIVAFIYAPIYIRYAVIVVIAGVIWIAGVATGVF